MMTNPSQANPLSRDITKEDNEFLTMEVIYDEIFDVMKQIHPLKALGPYGMQAIFYQKNGIVGKSVCNIVESFFKFGHMLKENRTYTTLIPKTANPNSVNHYKPISFCNISYKIISKILTKST